MKYYYIIIYCVQHPVPAMLLKSRCPHRQTAGQKNGIFLRTESGGPGRIPCAKDPRFFPLRIPDQL